MSHMTGFSQGNNHVHGSFKYIMWLYNRYCTYTGHYCNVGHGPGVQECLSTCTCFMPTLIKKTKSG